MIVNPDKFQAMLLNRYGKLENKHEMYIDDKKLTSEHAAKLLGIEIDNQLNFDSHVSITKWMLLVDLENTLVFLKKKTFVFSNFNYCPLVWHSPSMTSTNKIEFIQKRVFDCYIMAMLQPLMIFFQNKKNHQ